MIIVAKGGASISVPHPLAKSFPLSDGRPRRHQARAGYVPLLGREVRAATYEGIYRSQVWVYIVVTKWEKGVSRLPLKAYRFADAEQQDRTRVRDHPLVRLLNNPWPGGSAYQLKQFIVGSRKVHGNALLVKTRPGAGRAPVELWPIPWRHIEVVENRGRGVDHYIFHGDKAKIRILPEEAIHFRQWGEGGPVGLSPIEPLRRTLALEDAAQQWSGSHFEKGAAPSGAFTTDKKISDLTFPRLRAELDSLYGGVDNAGRFAILDQGLKFDAVQMSAVDSRLIEQRKLSREEVAAAYDMPPPMIGILDRATFANISEQRRMQYVDTIGPELNDIEETLMVQLVRPERDFADVFVEFDLSAVLQGDPERRSVAYLRWLNSATYTPNELRRMENLKAIGDPDDPDNPANQIYVPANLLPVGAGVEELQARAAIMAGLGSSGQPPELVEPTENGHREDVGDTADMLAP